MGLVLIGRVVGSFGLAWVWVFGDLCVFGGLLRLWVFGGRFRVARFGFGLCG